MKCARQNAQPHKNKTHKIYDPIRLVMLNAIDRLLINVDIIRALNDSISSFLVAILLSRLRASNFFSKIFDSATNHHVEQRNVEL